MMQVSVTCCDSEMNEEVDLTILEFKRSHLDFSTASFDDINEYQNNWEKVILPNDEEILIRFQFGKGFEYSLLNIKQDEHGLVSFGAKEIFYFSFKTKMGLGIGLQFFEKNT